MSFKGTIPYSAKLSTILNPNRLLENKIKEEKESKEGKDNLFLINEDILLYILGFIIPREQFRLTLTSKAFASKILSFPTDLSWRYASDIYLWRLFKRYPKTQIDKIDLYQENQYDSSSALINLCKKSPKITSLSLETEEEESMIELFPLLTNLQELKLTNCYVYSENVFECASLTSLYIKNGYLESFGGIKMLTKLKTLKVEETTTFSTTRKIKHMPVLEELCLEECTSCESLGTFENCPKLEKVILSSCTDLLDIGGLANLTSLKTLILRHNKGFDDINYLSRCTNLEKINLYDESISSLTFLNNCTNLRSIEVKECPLEDIDNILEINSLRKLKIINCGEPVFDENVTFPNLEKINFTPVPYFMTKLPIFRTCSEDLSKSYPINLRELNLVFNRSNFREFDISGLKECLLLETLFLSYITSENNLFVKRIVGYEVLLSLTKLKHFEIYNCNIDNLEMFRNANLLENLVIAGGNISSFKGIGNCINLKIFKGYYNGLIEDFDIFENFVMLEKFSIKGYHRIEDLHGLRKCDKLKEVDIEKCSKLENINSLRGCIKLSDVTIENCPNLRNINCFKKCTNISNLTINNINIDNIECIREMKKLLFLKINEVLPIEDISPLADKTKLIHLEIGNCSKIASLENLEKLIRLRILRLCRCIKITNVKYLGKMNNLAILDLKEIKRIDLEDIKEMEELQYLSLSECYDINGVEKLENSRRGDWGRKKKDLIITYSEIGKNDKEVSVSWLKGRMKEKQKEREEKKKIKVVKNLGLKNKHKSNSGNREGGNREGGNREGGNREGGNREGGNRDREGGNRDREGGNRDREGGNRDREGGNRDREGGNRDRRRK